MTVTYVTTLTELEDILEEHRHVVIDFSDPVSCIPCQRLKPHFEKAAEILSGVQFVYVNIREAEYSMLEEYGVTGVPALFGWFGDSVKPVVLKERTAPTLLREVQGLIDGLGK